MQQRHVSIGRPDTAGHLKHRSDDHTHHVTQKGIRLDTQHQLILAFSPFAAGHGSLKEDVLGLRRSERREVMRAGRRSRTLPQC